MAHPTIELVNGIIRMGWDADCLDSDSNWPDKTKAKYVWLYFARFNKGNDSMWYVFEDGILRINIKTEINGREYGKRHVLQYDGDNLYNPGDVEKILNDIRLNYEKCKMPKT